MTVHKLTLFIHRGDHRFGGFGIKLCRGGLGDPAQIPGGLDHHALEAKANAESGNPVLAGVSKCSDLAIQAANTKATGNEYGIHIGELLGGAILGFTEIRGNPRDINSYRIGEAAGP